MAILNAVEIGQNIHRIRYALGMKQYALAAKVGVSRGMMSQIESGNRQMTLATFCRIRHALGCSADILLVKINGVEHKNLPASRRLDKI